LPNFGNTIRRSSSTNLNQPQTTKGTTRTQAIDLAGLTLTDGKKRSYLSIRTATPQIRALKH